MKIKYMKKDIFITDLIIILTVCFFLWMALIGVNLVSASTGQSPMPGLKEDSQHTKSTPPAPKKEKKTTGQKVGSEIDKGLSKIKEETEKAKVKIGKQLERSGKDVEKAGEKISSPERSATKDDKDKH